MARESKGIKNFLIFCLLSSVFCLLVNGCATTTGLRTKPSTPGFYYNMQRGDTLYRIAKTNGIDLDRLVTINKIHDAARIEIGQRIFIPKIANFSPQRTESYSQSDLGEDSFLWPTKGTIISYFNQRSSDVLNKGIDIKTKAGQDVLASQSGIVSFSGELLRGQGRTVIIQHKNRLSTVYNHNAEVFVKVDDRVMKGQVIAKVGVSGRIDIPYLHFEIREGSSPRNPLYYLPR